MPAKAPASLVDELFLQLRLDARRLLPEFAQLSVQQCTSEVIRQRSDALDVFVVVVVVAPHRGQVQVEAVEREPVEADGLPPVPVDARVPVLGIPDDRAVERFLEMPPYLVRSPGPRPAEEQAEGLVRVRRRRSTAVVFVVFSVHIRRQEEEVSRCILINSLLILYWPVDCNLPSMFTFHWRAVCIGAIITARPDPRPRPFSANREFFFEPGLGGPTKALPQIPPNERNVQLARVLAPQPSVERPRGL